MSDYTYISNLCKAVLEKSKQIQGRFYILPKKGLELNTDDLDQIINTIPPDQPCSPIAVMVPPRAYGDYGIENEWEQFEFTIFFLQTTYYNGANQISEVNPYTQTSMKTILEHWDEMKLSATGFMRTLQKVQRGVNSTNTNMLNNLFRLDSGKKIIDPVSYIGANRYSGVRLTFNGTLFIPCTNDDFENINTIVLP